jgi:hypothetical protein
MQELVSLRIWARSLVRRPGWRTSSPGDWMPFSSSFALPAPVLTNLPLLAVISQGTVVVVCAHRLTGRIADDTTADTKLAMRARMRPLPWVSGSTASTPS